MSKNLNILELRSGLLEIGFTLNETITLIKVFDKNMNGSVSLEEFMEIFGKSCHDFEGKIIILLFFTKIKKILYLKLL